MAIKKDYRILEKKRSLAYTNGLKIKKKYYWTDRLVGEIKGRSDKTCMQEQCAVNTYGLGIG